jgi:hypothetical protein
VLGYCNIEIGQEVAKGTKVMFEDPVEFQFVTKGVVFRAPRPVNTLKNASDERYVEMSGYHASEHVMIEGMLRKYHVLTVVCIMKTRKIYMIIYMIIYKVTKQAPLQVKSEIEASEMRFSISIYIHLIVLCFLRS